MTTEPEHRDGHVDATGEADTQPPVDRSAAFAAGPGGIPRRFVYVAVAAFVVLGLGGLLAEHVFSAAGLNPTASTTNPKSSGASASAAGNTGNTGNTGAGDSGNTGAGSTGNASPTGGSGSIGSSLSSFMGLDPLPGGQAPGFTLTDQLGQPFSLSGARGTAVVLTFFDGRCLDICPVLAAELRRAASDLGAAAGRVTFVTVNTDPDATSVGDLSAAVARVAGGSGKGAPPAVLADRWEMLTGPVARLNAVWRAYGVTIEVDPSTGVMAHNDVMFFLSPSGAELYRATPFADESSSGSYSLPAASIARWARGIAQYAAKAAAP